jgi:hypothetical protein
MNKNTLQKDLDIQGLSGALARFGLGSRFVRGLQQGVEGGEGPGPNKSERTSRECPAMERADQALRVNTDEPDGPSEGSDD